MEVQGNNHILSSHQSYFTGSPFFKSLPSRLSEGRQIHKWKHMYPADTLSRSHHELRVPVKCTRSHEPCVLLRQVWTWPESLCILCPNHTGKQDFAIWGRKAGEPQDSLAVLSRKGSPCTAPPLRSCLRGNRGRLAGNGSSSPSPPRRAALPARSFISPSLSNPPVPPALRFVAKASQPQITPTPGNPLLLVPPHGPPFSQLPTLKSHQRASQAASLRRRLGAPSGEHVSFCCCWGDRCLPLPSREGRRVSPPGSYLGRSLGGEGSLDSPVEVCWIKKKGSSRSQRGGWRPAEFLKWMEGAWWSRLTCWSFRLRPPTSRRGEEAPAATS